MAKIQPEPILDVVRGLSTVASFAIVVNQLKEMYDTFFVSCCDHCRGTGIVTCPHCHGTKTLRRRPGFIRTRDAGIVDDPRNAYQCIYCGPPTQYDFNPFAPDDENQAMKIQENLKQAVANVWPRPFEMGALAGTVSCPQCQGSPRIRRFTPDFGKALGLEPHWDSRIYMRLGRYFFGQENRPAGRERLYLEYPREAPRPIELPAAMPQKKSAQAATEGADMSGGMRLSSSGAFSLDDYILPWASDDDEGPQQ